MKLITPSSIEGHPASVQALQAAMPYMERVIDAAVAQLIAVSDAGKAWANRADDLRNMPGIDDRVVYLIQGYLPGKDEQTRGIEKNHRKITRVAVNGIAQIVSEVRRVAWTDSLSRSVDEAVQDEIDQSWPDTADHLADDDRTGPMLLVDYYAAVNRMLEVALQHVIDAAAGPNEDETLVIVRELEEFSRLGAREPRMVSGNYELTLAASLRKTSRPSYAMAAGARMLRIGQALLAPYYHSRGEVMPVSQMAISANQLDGAFDLGDELMFCAGVKLVLRKTAIKIRVPADVMVPLLLLLGDRIAPQKR